MNGLVEPFLRLQPDRANRKETPASDAELAMQAPPSKNPLRHHRPVTLSQAGSYEFVLLHTLTNLTLDKNAANQPPPMQ